MKIMPARLKDSQEISEVELNSGYPKKEFDALTMINNLLRDRKEHAFVAKIRNKVVGYTSLRKLSNRCEITFLAVSENYQNKGIGTELIKHAIKLARKFKCKKLTLDVRNGNTKAIRLYAKLGFKIVGIKNKADQTKFAMEKINFFNAKEN